MKGIEWSKTGGVETQHATGLDLIPDKTVEEYIKEVRDLVYGVAPIHRSEFEKRINWEFDPNNLSKAARALELMFDSGELEEDEEGVVYYDSDIDTKEVMNMVEIEVHETFKAGGETYEEGKTYEVNQELADKVESAGYASEKIGKKAEELPEIEIEEEEEGEEVQIEPGEGDVWDQLDKEAKTQREKPPNWNPETGDKLHGTVISTGQGPNSRFVEVEVAKNSVKARQKVGEEEYEEQTVQPGDNVLLWESTTLEDFFDQVKAGMKIAVHYEGKQKTSSGQKAKMFDTAMREA